MRVITLSAEVDAAPRHVPRVQSQLLFDCDLEEKALEAARSATLGDAEYVRRLKLYSEPWGAAEVRLGELVQQALSPRGRGGPPPGEAAVAAHVGSRGFSVTMRTALGGRSTTECLKNLKHKFLTCRQQSWPHPQHFIIDLCFREQFEICRPTPRYAEALACVPEVFVGAEERLLALVEILCREMTAAFEEAGTPLPPWRQAAAMLSKWQPRRSQDVPVTPPSPAPASTRGGAALEGSVRGSPFAAQARATFANISNGLSAFLPAAQSSLTSGSTKPTARARPKSSLLAASLNGSSGSLPPNISLPQRGPGGVVPAANAFATGRRLTTQPAPSGGPLQDVPSALSWADAADQPAAFGSSLYGSQGSSLARGQGLGGDEWASSLLGMDTRGRGHTSCLVSGF